MQGHTTPFSDESQALCYFSTERERLSQSAKICILARDPELTILWLQENEKLQELLKADIRSQLTQQ